MDILATKQAILVFTGAGISTESGIPDFRGPDGVWTKVDPADFTFERYVANPEVRQRSWAMRAGSGVLDALPNDGHRAVKDLWDSGRMIGCVTQNIDGLHAAAGLPERAFVELHGNARSTRCLECDEVTPTTEVVARVDAGDRDPHCPRCGGLLKVDVVFFGEEMPPGAMQRATSMAAACDAVIAVGSTLSVYPAAYVPVIAVDAGSPLVIINRGDTDLDHLAGVALHEPAGSTLRIIINALM